VFFDSFGFLEFPGDALDGLWIPDLLGQLKTTLSSSRYLIDMALPLPLVWKSE
jgi:hypothetical protein